jgi:hypothetical protein
LLCLRLQNSAGQSAALNHKKRSGQANFNFGSGMYSGNRSFESFIARNQSQYKIFLLIPPGLNGTAARAMPTAGTSFGGDDLDSPA